MPRVRMVPGADQQASPISSGICDTELEEAGLLNGGEQLPGSAPAPSDPAPDRGGVRRRRPETHTEEEEIVPAAEAQPAADSKTFTPNKILFGKNRHAMARDRFIRANRKIVSGIRMQKEIEKVQAEMDPEQRELKKMRELFDAMDGARTSVLHAALLNPNRHVFAAANHAGRALCGHRLIAAAVAQRTAAAP
eukprot:COSAG02_NODE_1507_length_12231_cov_56.431751_6_plen_193_part_00